MICRLICILIFFISSCSGFCQGQWPESLIITPERTQFTKTSTYGDVQFFLESLQKLSPNVFVFSMGKSLEGKDIPVAVLSNPIIKNAEEAKASGKTIVYIQGNIHAGEVEGKEAIMMLMRDILLGDKNYLLKHLIILLAPIYNTDANDKMAKGLRPSQEDSPMETGQRESSEGFDLNRDGMKLDALETKGLFEKVIIPWDPQIFVDMHTTNGTWHAYPLTYAPAYHSSGEYSVFDYSYNKMLPEINKQIEEKYQLKFGVYGDYDLNEGWPIKNFYTYNHHPRYLVNQFGLRNRMAILSETFAHDRFNERIRHSYIFISEILEFAHKNYLEIVAVNKKADADAIKTILNDAGKVANGVKFKMVPLNTLTKFRTYNYLKTTDSSGKNEYFRAARVVELDSVTYFAKFDATLTSTIPQGYIIPKGFEKIIDNLKQHGIKVEQLQKGLIFSGETFFIDSFNQNKTIFQKHQTTTLYGKFKRETKKFTTGDYRVDLAQPLNHLIFYLLEPQSDDGLVHWNFLDENFKNQKSKKTFAYPIFKYYNKP